MKEAEAGLTEKSLLTQTEEHDRKKNDEKMVEFIHIC